MKFKNKKSQAEHSSKTEHPEVIHRAKTIQNKPN